MVFTLAALCAFFGLIYSRTALDRSAFDLQEIQAQVAAEQARYQELRLEVARLNAPSRIGPLASELGLVFPPEVHTLSAPGVQPPQKEAELRWAEVKSILTATP